MSLYSTVAQQRLPEILAPAGTMDQLQAAILYGANAVYLGGNASLRASRGFEGDALLEARRLTKEAGVALYFCCNALPRQRSLAASLASLEAGARAFVDAFIIADAGVFSLARRHFPHIPIHMSTQANTCNAASVAFWQDLGATRVNLARELQMIDILAIKRTCPDMELECFVHGAQCLAISGQCLLSLSLNQRAANSGQCTQPCRFTYRALPDQCVTVEESKRPDVPLWDVTQGEEGYSALWSPEDLCLLPYVPWFVRHGISSLKIEGRMRTGGYVAHVVDSYRQALHWCTKPKQERRPWRELSEQLLQNLGKWATRAQGTGFFAPKHMELIAAPKQKARGHVAVLARLEEEIRPGFWRMSVRGKWLKETSVRVVLPGGKRPVLEVGSYALENTKGQSVSAVHSGTEAFLHCDVEGLRPHVYIEQYDVL